MRLEHKERSAMLEQLNMYKNIAACYVAEGNKSCAAAYFYRFEGAIEVLHAMGLVEETEGSRMLADFQSRLKF